MSVYLSPKMPEKNFEKKHVNAAEQLGIFQAKSSRKSTAA